MSGAARGGVMCLVNQGCWNGAAGEFLLLGAVAVLLLGACLFWSAGAIGRRSATRLPWAFSQASESSGTCKDTEGDGCAVLCGVLAADSGPDIHLVMNTFNRLAGDGHLEGQAVDPVFVLSDYLRQCMVHTGPAHVALHEEINMLESYLRLAAVFHGCDLSASVELAPGSRDIFVQAHSICLVAQVLLTSLGPDLHGRHCLPVKVQGLPTGGINVDMALEVKSRPPNANLRHMRAELHRLGTVMSRRSVRWSCRVVTDHRSEIALSLRIRPHAAR